MVERPDGCATLAETISRCRPQMICAYPDRAHPRILDTLRAMAIDGTLAGCDVVDVESDAAAMSVAIGASGAGARTYTVTAGQGLLSMAAAVFDAAGLGLPIVMTVGDCANNPPTNTWNDHTDSMPMRDAGWIQLYAETDQEALDLHIQAFRLAEAIACPVMVCIDGYRLAHGCDRLDVPAQRQIDDYLPRYGYRPVAKVGVRSTRVMAGPETFMERCYLAHHKQLRALAAIPKLADDFRAQFGRPSGGLLKTYRLDDAETVVVGLGSVCGTIRNAVDELRRAGARIGCVSIGSFRPFPSCALRDALQHARRVVVIERSLAVGLSGIVSDGVREALSGLPVNTHTVIAGLGGRAIPATSLRQLFEDAAADGLGQTTFLDLNADLVARQLECEAQSRSSESATL